LPAEETLDAIVADEAHWDAQFAATDEGKLSALVASVEHKIDAGESAPIFDERGEFSERP
jgi:hypothetical protein